ncbi:MAG: helix-turn-helix domain-containing protein [Solirubrobacteraceae bacterium]
MSKTINMADRLRQLLDLVITAEPSTDGTALAQRAHFSRDHLDRLLAAATGETPAALRRRLLLERAAWQLAHGATASEAARDAGYGSVAAFSRAFARAYGTSPSRHAGPLSIDAPNGIHFHPPAGLLIPGARAAARHGLSDRMLAHHLARCHELLQAAVALPAADLERPLRPGLVVVWFEGEEASAAEMLRRLVGTLEVWVAAIAGEPVPELAGPLQPRLQRAGTALLRLVRSIRDRDAWDDAFIDALCEPPQSFTFGAVLSHILSFGAVRREALAAVLTELGAQLSDGDPITWELRTTRSA